MLDTLTSRNGPDFTRRYQGTFGYFPVKDKSLLIQIDRVTGTNVNFIDRDGYKYNAVVDSGVNFEFLQIDKGWYNNSEGSPIFFSRIPARQWQRGISGANTSCLTFTGTKSLMKIAVNFQTLDCLQNDYKSFIDAYRVNKISSVALNKYFAVDTCQQLWLFDLLVGTIKNDLVTLIYPEFKQEVIDCITRNKLPYVVV